MRIGSISLGLGIAAIAASGASGSACSAKKVTEIVPGATTQIQVPLDIAALRVDIKSNGATVSCTSYLAQDGSLVLPTTIGIIPKNDGSEGTTTITVEVRAYDNAGISSTLSDLQTCGTTPVGQPGGPRALRRSIQTFVDQHELFLPMPLSYSCFDVDCSADSNPSDACKGAQCVTADIDSTTLADFNPQLIDGTGVCFDPSTCFGDAVPAVPVDPVHCIFEFPETKVPSGGLNVRVFYQDGAWVYNVATSQFEQQITPKSEQEILNEDQAGSASEGFTIPDPTRPQQFQLAPGLCALYQQATTPPAPPTSGTTTATYHMISDVQVASLCEPKSALLPICAPQQKSAAIEADGAVSTSVTCGVPMTLEPVPSVLYLVMDDSKVMGGAFGAQGYATAMNLTLQNPAFKRTFVGFRFLDHCGSDAGADPYLSPAVVFGLAGEVQPKIAQLLLSPAPPDSACDVSTGVGCAPIDLVAATNPTTGGAYAEAASFAGGLGKSLNVEAVMFFVNRAPTTSSNDAGAGDASGVDGGGTAPGELSGAECPSVSGDEATALGTAAQKALSTSGLQTFYVVLSNDNASQPGDAPPLAFYDQVAQQAGQPQMVIDATQPIAMAQQAVQNFASVATGLGTCVYELPPGVDTSAQLSFTIPVAIPPTTTTAPVPVPVPYAPDCNAASQSPPEGGAAPNGWNIEGTPPSRIRICGASCANLQSTVQAVSALTLASDGGAASAPEVPVTVTMSCANAGD